MNRSSNSVGIAQGSPNCAVGLGITRGKSVGWGKEIEGVIFVGWEGIVAEDDVEILLLLVKQATLTKIKIKRTTSVIIDLKNIYAPLWSFSSKK